jgi:putative CocE/NonD family hydrolase
LNPLLPVARRLLGLSPRRHRSSFRTEWLRLSDGVRLATTVVQPVANGAARAPAILVRTASAAHARSHPALLWCRILAESGYVVVVQECRGRHASEGEFTPFEGEARDGRETIEWIAGQEWFDGRLGLVGCGYSGFTAWSALAEAPESVGALAVAMATRDPHALLYPGGAFALCNGLTWGVGLGEREAPPAHRLDLERAFPFRPIREADRVALRQVDWFRAWLDHPRPDAFWERVTPPLPAMPPPTLLVAGWYDGALGPQLDDYAALVQASRAAGSPAPELVAGPWSAPLRGGATIGTWAEPLRSCLSFLGRHLQGAEEHTAPVRVFVRGERRWCNAPVWPLPDSADHRLYLHSGGHANSLAGDGELHAEPPQASQSPDRFVYDPADPVPTRGGCLPSGRDDPADQRAVESRDDVLCYTTQPLSEDMVVIGRVRVELFAASNAPDTDFTAKLVDVAPDGFAAHLCDGALRGRWRDGASPPLWLEPDAPQAFEIDLWATAVRLRAGHRIRLEVSSSNFPRFDRNPNARADPAHANAEESAPARQTVHHDPDHPSRLVLPVVAAVQRSSPGAAVE